MSTVIQSEHNQQPFADDSDGSVVYDEDDCETDNEEEVKHDLVTCTKCGTKTHYLNEECGKCGFKFKISKTGYVLTGEDGDFLCDEGEAIEYVSDCYETPDIDKVSVSDEYDSDDDTNEDTSSSDDGGEETFCIDDGEYTSKKDVDHVQHAPRRITRSMLSTRKRPINDDGPPFSKQPKMN